MNDLSGRVVLVTGASSGLGAYFARAAASAGAAVALAARRTDKLAEIQSAIVNEGGRAAAIAMDVADENSVIAGFDAVARELGPVDSVIANAGMNYPSSALGIPLDEFDRVMDVNLRGVFHATQAVLPTMVAQGAGVILNASSVVGIYGNFGQTNYAASKFGVIGFTKTWSRELGPKGIRVNAVAPGFVETPILATIPDKVLQQMREQVPLHRLGKPEEIANVYAFLASDEASYINGAVIEVSGGMTV